MNRVLAAVFAVGVSLLLISSAEGTQKKHATQPATSGVDGKFAQIERNGKMAQPDSSPMQLTESEINAYLASDAVDMPAGVESLRLEGHPGNVVGLARVDFDKVRTGTKNPNPLLSLFTGIHDVVVTAQARGDRGHGLVRVQNVWFDGTEIPRFMVQLFVEKYLAPRYPGIGMESKFPLPSRIDSAVVGQHVLTVVQK